MGKIHSYRRVKVDRFISFLEEVVKTISVLSILVIFFLYIMWRSGLFHISIGN